MNKQNAFLALASWALMAFPASADDLASSSCPYHATSHSVLVFPMGFDRFLDVPDVRVAVPEGYIRPYERERYANDGTDGAARLFVEVPSLAPMFLQEGFSSSFRLETTVAPEDDPPRARPSLKGVPRFGGRGGCGSEGYSGRRHDRHTANRSAGGSSARPRSTSRPDPCGDRRRRGDIPRELPRRPRSNLHGSCFS